MRQSIQTRKPNTGSGLAQQMVGGGSPPGDNRDGNQGNGEKTEKVQHGAIRRNTIGMGRWNNADSGVPNGGVCQCRSKGDKDSIHRKTDTKIQHQPVPFYGIEIQLDQSEFFSKSGLVVLQRRKRNMLLHGSQHAGN